MRILLSCFRARNCGLDGVKLRMRKWNGTDYNRNMIVEEKVPRIFQNSYEIQCI